MQTPDPAVAEEAKPVHENGTAEEVPAPKNGFAQKK